MWDFLKSQNDLARQLARQIRSTKMASLLLAFLMFLTASAAIFFIFRTTLSETSATILLGLLLIFMFIFVIVFLIRLLPAPSTPNLATEISGLVVLNASGVAGARVKLLTANGDSTTTDQDGIFRLLPDPAQREWEIKATYDSPGGNKYTGTKTIRPQDAKGKRVTIELKPADDSVEEIIFDKLSHLKIHIDNHRKRIEETVKPLIEDNNLVGTMQQFNELVEHHQPWSEPYATLLYGNINLKDAHLNDPNLQAGLDKAVAEIESFQACAFVLSYQSFVQKSLLYDALSLYNEYSSGTNPADCDSLRAGVRNSMIESFKTLVADEDRQQVFAQMPLNTPRDVQEFVKAWCMAWKHKVQAADSHGFLKSAITDFDAAVNRPPA